MPIELVVNPGPTERRYRTSVIYVQGSQFDIVGDSGSGAGNDGVTLTPLKDPRVILVTFDGQPDTELGPGHIAKILPLEAQGLLLSWRITTDIDCDVVLKLWRDSIDNGDPTAADDITGGNPIGLTAARYGSGVPTGAWNIDVMPDDVWLVTIDSIDVGVKFLQLQLVIQT